MISLLYPVPPLYSLSLVLQYLTFINNASPKNPNCHLSDLSSSLTVWKIIVFSVIVNFSFDTLLKNVFLDRLQLSDAISMNSLSSFLYMGLIVMSNRKTGEIVRIPLFFSGKTGLYSTVK